MDKRGLELFLNSNIPQKTSNNNLFLPHQICSNISWSPLVFCPKKERRAIRELDSLIHVPSIPAAPPRAKY